MTSADPVDTALLARLSEAAAPSGEERAVAAILRQEFESLGLDVSVDRVGNLSARAPGRDGAARRVAVLSHMDEVGLVVRRVMPDGFLKVVRIGGIGRRSLAARPVRLLGSQGEVLGLLGVKSHHLTDPAEVQTLPPVEDAYVDIGARSVEEVQELGVDVGTKAVFDQPVRRIAGGRISGKAMDNRALCLALVEIARRLVADPPPGDVVLVGTVREEFNLRGSVAAMATIRPDLALVLDVSPATDTPDLDHVAEMRLGKGPAIKYFDFHGRGPLAGYIAPLAVSRFLQHVADRAQVPVQREAIIGLVTDASEIASMPDPSVVACLSLPTRYTHSPVETIDLADLARLIDLSIAAIRKVTTEDALFQPPW